MPRRSQFALRTDGRPSRWVVGVLAGLLTLAALVVGSEYGNVHAVGLHPRLIAWICAAVLLVAGVLATARLSVLLSHLASKGSLAPAAAAVRVLAAVVGYVFVAFATLTVMAVSIERLLVGAGLAGIVLGIAAQQSLGNVFAGFVLIVARPFAIGDHLRIRSGALGGIFEAWVVDISLTYVTLRTDDGQLKVPNSAMLAAGVGQLPPAGATPGAVSPVPAPAQSPAVPPATGTPAPPAVTSVPPPPTGTA